MRRICLHTHLALVAMQTCKLSCNFAPGHVVEIHGTSTKFSKNLLSLVSYFLFVAASHVQFWDCLAVPINFGFKNKIMVQAGPTLKAPQKNIVFTIFKFLQ